VAEKDADLAVLDAAGRARVLPLHAGRLRALLDEAGLVDHQHGVLIAEMLDRVGPQVVAHGLGIPAHAEEEVLHPVGRAVARGLGQLPAVLALDRRQQALEIRRRPPARLDPKKARRDPRRQRVEPTRPIGSIIHRSHDLALHGR
jgi:hypothetical protein